MQHEITSDIQRREFTGSVARHAVIAELEAHIDELDGMGIRYLAIFGSVSRDEAGPDSDVDILVDLERPAGLLKLGHLQNYLRTLLRREVDVIPRDSVRTQLEGRIAREALRVL